MAFSINSTLPAALIADKVNEVLKTSNRLIITAPPGAGKSTLLPLTILQGMSGEGRVVMLEPRRLAARQIAERMSQMIGEPVGRTVGYRVRFENKVSESTRIEVVTEGILTRRLVNDPTLEGVSVIIFDEFHERSLSSDLALVLSMEMQGLLRDDVRIVLMSATIDTETLHAQFGGQIIQSQGRMFPVEVKHFDERVDNLNAAETVARYVRKAMRENEGDILAFLPGQAEILKCKDLLPDLPNVYPLYGNLPIDQQQKAIAPSTPGERKIVLATSIAETSLTIEGVRVVIDSGLCRRLVFDKRNGFSRLETVLESKDMADQRSGRAGRVAEGICYRLWSMATEHKMEPCRIPEVQDADLASMLLDVAGWGTEVEDLPWITMPPKANIIQARTLLTNLGALDNKGKITSLGKKMSQLPCHPRIAKMLLTCKDSQQKSLAADIAAILEEKDVISIENDTDINIRLEALLNSRKRQQLGPWTRVAKIATEYRKLVRADLSNDYPNPYEVGLLLALAYPERIAMSVDNVGRYRTASGDNVILDNSDLLTANHWISIATLNAATGRVFLAAPLKHEDLMTLTVASDNVSWDSKNGQIISRRESRIGKLVVDSKPIPYSEVKELAKQVIASAAQKEGRSMLDFNEDVQRLQIRIATLSKWHPELALPDLSTDSILESSHEWLPFYLEEDGRLKTTIPELKRINLKSALWNLLSYEQQQEADRLAPTHITVPTGSKIRVDYRQGADAPVLSVRLQECFGLADTPRVNGGTQPVLMELLSPGFKPVQLTMDLHSFWENTYFEVSKELKRRYPKHYWPTNPLEAEATRGVRKK